MPTIYLTGDDGSEQAVGPVVDTNKTRLFAANQNNLLQLYDLGGHAIPDAPEYTTTERKVYNEYKSANGVNFVEEVELVPEQITGISFPVNLPHKLITQARQLRQLQNVGNTFDGYIAPTALCQDECDNWFELMKTMSLGSIRKTVGMVGYGADANVQQHQMPVTAKGDFTLYLGLQANELVTGLPDIYAFYQLDDPCAEGGGCPYQTWAAVGATGMLRVTDDKWGSNTAITTTAITTDTPSAIITDVIQLPSGKIVVAYSDVARANSTDGGVAYSVDEAAAVLSTMGTTSTGVQTLEYLNGKVYAAGDNGQFYQSCDDALTFELMTTPIGAETINMMKLDKSTNNIYIVTTGPGLWRFDGSSFTDLTSFVGASGSSDFLSIDTLGPDAIIIGGSDGFVHQSFNASSSEPSFTSELLGGNPAHGVAGDEHGARAMAASGAVWKQRDVNSKQEWRTRDTFGGPVLAMARAKAISEEGTNYYLIGTDGGSIIELASCFECSVAASC